MGRSRKPQTATLPAPVVPPAPAEPAVTQAAAAAAAAAGESGSIRTISLAEPDGQRTSASGWAKRAKVASAELSALQARFVAHRWRVENHEQIIADTFRILMQTLVAEGRISAEELASTPVRDLFRRLTESGELSPDEMVARCAEVQLMYLRPQFQQRATASRTPKPPVRQRLRIPVVRPDAHVVPSSDPSQE